MFNEDGMYDATISIKAATKVVLKRADSREG
jgi:hypothetical protein